MVPSSSNQQTTLEFDPIKALFSKYMIILFIELLRRENYLDRY